MVTSRAVEGTVFRAISSHKEILWVRASMNIAALQNFLESLDKLRTGLHSPNAIVDGDTAQFCFWVLPDQAAEISELVKKAKLENCLIERAALVAASGSGIADSAEAIATVSKILGGAKIPFMHIGTTNRSVYAIVSQSDCDSAAKQMHLKLIEMPQKKGRDK